MDRKIALLLGSLGVAQAQKVAYAPGHGVAKSTYAASDPVSGREWMVKYLPVSEAPDDCTGGICTCTTAGTWEIQQGRVQLDEESGGRGFGLHLVNLTARATTGGATVEAVEAAWTARLGDMTKFDAFMDHHVGLYTDDLEQYLSAFDADAVPYYLMSFTAGGDTWHAANVRVPGSQLLIELLATNYTGAHRMAAAPAPAPRLGDARAAELKAMTTDRAYVYAVRVARACTDLDAVAAFYTGALGATQVSETATRKCWKLATTSAFTDTTEVCYTEHADDASDAMTVKEYEDALNGAHASLLKGQPKCGMDKWLDNHLAVDPTDHGSNDYGDALVAYVDATADLYYYCEPAMGPGASGYTLHYVIDPAGWGVQVDASFTSPPQACASSSLAIVEGDFNPACDLGTCSSL